MTDNCGQVSSLDKLVGSITRDEILYRLELEGQPIPKDAEYFEFKKAESSANWTSEFVNLKAKSDVPLFPPSFEQAFGAINIASAPAAWVSEYLPTQASLNRNWIHEYTSQESTTGYDSTALWAQEFAEIEKQGGDDRAALRDTAAEILSNLEYEQDPKLKASRFVAYLQQLAGTDTANVMNHTSFEGWKQSFLQGLDSMPQSQEDSQWLSMEKTWEKHQSTGLGYQEFAEKEFGQYHFSVPMGANPYRGASDRTDSLRNTTPHDMKSKILILEALVQEEPSNPAAWRDLGVAQQANEMDPQAIAAFLQATRLDRLDAQSWVGLAASCVNESCVPDALKALSGFIYSQSKSIVESGNLDMSQYRVAIEELCRQNPTHAENLLAASIICGLQGEKSEALRYIQEASNLPGSDWSIQNRLGATLANSHRYNDALEIYKSLQSQGHVYSRIHYNEGIALMCVSRHEEAARAFVRAIDTQLPVDIVSNIKPELLLNYSAPMEALRTNFAIWGNEAFAADCDQSQLPLIKSQLGM